MTTNATATKHRSSGGRPSAFDVLDRSISELEARIKHLDAVRRQPAPRARHADPASEAAMRRRLTDRDRQRPVATDDLSDRALADGLDALRDDMAGLCHRLGDIQRAVADVPSALPLDGLCDRIDRLAIAIDAVTYARPSADPEMMHRLSVFDERFDGIDRAVAAIGAAGADGEDIKRIEQRLDLLADHIDRLEQPEWREAIAHQIAALAERIEALAADRPRADPLIVAQLDAIARKVDAFDGDALLRQLAEPLRALSARIDDIEADLAATNSNQEMLYGQLRGVEADLGAGMARCDAVDLEPLQTGLADIAARLENSRADDAAREEGFRNLDSQVAHLSSLLARPTAPDPKMEQRLAAVEQRNACAFQAVQDTLLKIAGRMDALERGRERLAGEPIGPVTLQPDTVTNVGADAVPSASGIGHNPFDKAVLLGLLERLRGSREAKADKAAANAKTDLIAAARRAVAAETVEPERKPADRPAGGTPGRLTGSRNLLLFAAGAVLLATLMYSLIAGSNWSGPVPGRAADPASTAQPLASLSDDPPRIQTADTPTGRTFAAKTSKMLIAGPRPPQRLSTQNGIQASGRFAPKRAISPIDSQLQRQEPT